MINKEIVYCILIFLVNNIIIWYQLNSQLVWEWAKGTKSMWMMALLGIPISLMFWYATKIGYEGFGTLWSVRFMGFATSMLTFHMLKKSGLDVGIAGNVGESLARQVAEEDKSFYVLELSSFQLERINQFHPHVAVFTNLAPDHLNRYADVDAYAAAKRRLIENLDEEDSFVFPAGDPRGEAWAKESPAAPLRMRSSPWRPSSTPRPSP